MLPHSEAETIVEWQRKTERGGRMAKREERERKREDCTRYMQAINLNN